MKKIKNLKKLFKLQNQQKNILKNVIYQDKIKSMLKYFLIKQIFYTK